VDVPPTPGIAAVSRDQVLASPLLSEHHAYSSGLELDEAGFPYSSCGCLQLRGLGLCYLTRGRHPRRRPSAGATKLREAGSEVLDHSVMHLFGVFLGPLFRALFRRSPERRRKRLAKKMLRFPASFVVPWPALAAAENGPPTGMSPWGEELLVDPLHLTFGAERRVIYLLREPGATSPAVSVEDVFRARARYELLSVALSLLSGTIATNGKRPFGYLQMWQLSTGWFGNDAAGALERLVTEVGSSVTAEGLTQDALGVLDRFPIGAALGNGRVANELELPAPPADGWAFSDTVRRAELAPWLDAL
jgi:hypothetical protein